MGFKLPDLQDEEFFPFIFKIIMGLHVFLLIVYFSVGSLRMSAAGSISVLIYFLGLKYLVPKRLYFAMVMVIFAETLTHVMCGVVFFGWECGFQLWYFGLISAFYCMAFLKDKFKSGFKGSMMVTVTYTAAYWLLYKLTSEGKIRKTEVLKASSISWLYFMNLMIAVWIIAYFAYLFTQHVDLGQKRLHRRADYDELTGLYNRYLLNHLLDVEMKKMKSRKHVCWAAIADIDFFKKVNDNYGHNVGDTVLKQVADHMRGNLRKGETFGRWGGEEFLILSQEDMTMEQFREALEGLRRSVERSSFGESGQMLHITISIGMAEYKDQMTAEDFIKAADDRLYEAKQTGRNKVVG